MKAVERRCEKRATRAGAKSTAARCIEEEVLPLLGPALARARARATDAEKPQRPDGEEAGRDADVAPDELVPVLERVERPLEAEVVECEADVLRARGNAASDRS